MANALLVIVFSAPKESKDAAYVNSYFLAKANAISNSVPEEKTALSVFGATKSILTPERYSTNPDSTNESSFPHRYNVVNDFNPENIALVISVILLFEISSFDRDFKFWKLQDPIVSI